MMKQIIWCFFFGFFMVLYSCSTNTDGVALSADGVQINYHVEGKGEPAIVFVHGWTNNWSIWNAQLDHFSKNHKVSAIDLAGFGASGNNRTAWTMQAFADDVVAVVDKCKLEKVVLVGFSMGAPVVMEAANKLAGRVSGVVLVDHLKDVELFYPPHAMIFMDSMMMDLVTNPKIEKLQGGFFTKNVEESFQRVLDMLEGTSKIGWSESLIESMIWINTDMKTAFKQIKVPVHAIHTDQEPVDVEGFKQYVPSFKANIVAGSGHVIMWDAPDEFNRLLEESIREFSVQ